MDNFKPDNSTPEPSVVELYKAYLAAERNSASVTADQDDTPQYCKYLQAFMEMCATPSTSIADTLAKQEAFLKMELEGQQGKNFEEVIAAPLSDLDLVMCAAVSVYRDLKRLANS